MNTWSANAGWPHEQKTKGESIAGKSRCRSARESDNGRGAGGRHERRGRWLAAGVCALLVLAVAAVFGQTLGHDFVNYDDNEYVYSNPHITRDPPARDSFGH